MFTDMSVGLLQRINQPQCCWRRILIEVVFDGFIDRPVSRYTREDGLELHPQDFGFVPDRTRSRSAVKYALATGAVD